MDTRSQEALRLLRQEADARFQRRKEYHEEQARQAESDWREAIEALDNIRAILGGSEDDPASPAPRTTGGAETNGHSPDHAPQETLAPRSSGKNIVSKDTVMKYVHEVMADPSVEIVTQTEIKDRILANQPVSKNYLNSLRILIIGPLNELVEQGALELVERARAGKPNRYRKTGKAAEASLLET